MIHMNKKLDKRVIFNITKHFIFHDQFNCKLDEIEIKF